MTNLALDFTQDKPATLASNPGHVAPAKLPNDCILSVNLYSGFAPDHNGRCPKAATDPNVHLTATTHHVRIGGSCLEVCSACAASYAKRRDAIVRELRPEGYPDNPGPAGGVYAKHLKGASR